MPTPSSVVLVSFALLASALPVTQPSHIVLISVDGLSGLALSSRLAGEAGERLPNLSRLVREGATTFEARTDHANTDTLPNHTTMLVGRSVDDHRWTLNGTNPSRTVHGRNPDVPYLSSVFDVIHDHGLTTALRVQKCKFRVFDRSWNANNGAPDVVGPDNGRDKIDRTACEPARVKDGQSALFSNLIQGLLEDPTHFTFVHYGELDEVGHESGWESPRWSRALEDLDRQLGQLLAALDSHPSLAGRTVLLLTADHGGRLKGHSNNYQRENYTIPFLVWGKGVAHGAELYALNEDTRARPGRTRPDYAAKPQPIRNGDAANLILSLLRLPAVPGSTINASQDLRVGPRHSGGQTQTRIGSH